jgi:hypothetical protein
MWSSLCKSIDRIKGNNAELLGKSETIQPFLPRFCKTSCYYDVDDKCTSVILFSHRLGEILFC